MSSSIVASNKYYDVYYPNKDITNENGVIPSGSSIKSGTLIGKVNKEVSMKSQWYDELKVKGSIKFDSFIHKGTGSPPSLIEKHTNEDIYFCDGVTYLSCYSSLSNIVVTSDYYGEVCLVHWICDIPYYIECQVKNVMNTFS